MSDEKTDKSETKYKEHYVCIGGCGKVANQRIKCRTQGCSRYRNPLTQCFCTDGEHEEFKKYAWKKNKSEIKVIDEEDKAQTELDEDNNQIEIEESEENKELG